MRSFIENIIGIIIKPKTTIYEIAQTRPVGQAFCVIVLLSLISALIGHKTGFDGKLDFIFFCSNLLGILFSSLLIWLSLAGFFALSARVFRDEKQFRKMLALMGFSLIPWGFSAPLLFVKINALSLVIATILEIAIWLWSIWLVFYSVYHVYELSVKKTLLFFVTPILGMTIITNWVAQLYTILVSLF